jgi:curli biogenesis system outer membrane secretion channel CsgG
VKLLSFYVIFILFIVGVLISGTINAVGDDDFPDELGYEADDHESSYNTQYNKSSTKKPGYRRKSSRRNKRSSKKRGKSYSENYEPPPFQIPYDPNIPAKRVLISSFDVAVTGLPSGISIEKGLRAQLMTTLSKSKNFIIIDRETLSDLQDELNLAQVGAVTKKTAVKAGRLLGAQIIIKGVVTEFSEEAKGKSSGYKFNLGTIAGVANAFTDTKGLDIVEAINPEIGGGNETVSGTVGLDIRMIDVETGTVIHSIAARGNITKEKSSRSFGIAGFSTMSEGFENTVIGQAVRLAIQDAVLQIFEGMGRVPWKGTVAAVKYDGTVVINAGSNKNIRPGQLMYVAYEVQVITDPETGLVLYTENEKIGVIRIISVKANVSFAETLSGDNIKRGDTVTMKYD